MIQTEGLCEQLLSDEYWNDSEPVEMPSAGFLAGLVDASAILLPSAQNQIRQSFHRLQGAHRRVMVMPGESLPLDQQAPALVRVVLEERRRRQDTRPFGLTESGTRHTLDAMAREMQEDPWYQGPEAVFSGTVGGNAVRIERSVCYAQPARSGKRLLGVLASNIDPASDIGHVKGRYANHLLPPLEVGRVYRTEGWDGQLQRRVVQADILQPTFRRSGGRRIPSIFSFSRLVARPSTV